MAAWRGAKSGEMREHEGRDGTDVVQRCAVKRPGRGRGASRIGNQRVDALAWHQRRRPSEAALRRELMRRLGPAEQSSNGQAGDQGRGGEDGVEGGDGWCECL